MKSIRWLVLSLFLLPGIAIGENEKQAYEKIVEMNLSGWKGIVFICSYDPQDNVLERICQRAIADIELIAANARVELETVDPNDFFNAGIIASRENFVILEYELTATQNKSQLDAKAIHARLMFRNYYSKAIQKDSRPNTIENMPRSGNLDLWSTTVIGYGLPPDIISQFSYHVETQLKKAVTLFVNYAIK